MSPPDAVPDYAAFTLDELLDAYGHVDGTRYRDRAREIEGWIARRRAGESPVPVSPEVNRIPASLPSPADPNDPYRPPAAPLELPASAATAHLASRSRRLVAALLERAMVGLPQVVALVALRAFEDPAAFLAAQPPFMVVSWASTLALLAVNVVLWSRRAQSLGKIVLGARIAHRDGHPAAMWRILARQLPLPVLGLGAGLLGHLAVSSALICFVLLDVLFIFGPARRCLHDYWAGTIVTTATPANDPRLVPRG